MKQIKVWENPIERLSQLDIEGSEKTVKAYKVDIGQYIEYCSEKDLAIGDIESLQAFKDYLITKFKPSTVNRKITAVKQALRKYAEKYFTGTESEMIKGLYKKVKHVKKGDSEKRITKEKVLSDSEVKELIEGASERLSLMIQFLAITGCRVSEMLGVRLNDIQEKEGVYHISVIGKGEKSRVVRVEKSLIRQINNIFLGKEYLFETQTGNRIQADYVTKQIVKSAKRILNRHVNSHMFRHTFATEKIQKTGKIKAVSEYLGHASTSITLDMYVHETLDDNELFPADPAGTRETTEYEDPDLEDQRDIMQAFSAGLNKMGKGENK